MRYCLPAAALGVALAVCAACGGSKTTRFVKPRLAVEFPPSADHTDREPWQLAIPVDGGVGTEIGGDNLRPLSGTAPGPSMTLSLGFEDRGDKVAATVYTVPPESDPLRWSDGHKRLLGVYSGRLNGVIELRELRQLGYQPMILKIVKAAPLVHAKPALVSRAPSVEIAFAGDDIQAYMVGADRGTQSCTVILRNLSSHGVVAYILQEGEDPKAGISRSQQRSNFFGKPVIPPGAQSETVVITFGPSFRQTRQQVIVAAAIFDDGSWEGDDEAASRLRAKEIGYSIVNRRTAPIIDHIVQDKTLNDEVRTARIKDEIFRVSSQPDQATIGLLHKQFPKLPGETIVQSLTAGLDGAKDFLWGELYGYVRNCCQYPPPDHILLADWWRSTRHLIQPLL
jgi:hypothetical protein